MKSSIRVIEAFYFKQMKLKATKSLLGFVIVQFIAHVR
jgi:hypothetical protein